MSFSTDLAALVANQLSRFVTLHPHQLAGQVENLDFWLDQVQHALEAIDGYALRFVRMQGGQERYVSVTGATLWSGNGPNSENVIIVPTKGVKNGIDAHPTGVAPPPPRRISHHELNKARRELIEATTSFLVRCRQEDLVTEQRLADITTRLGLDPVSVHFPA